MIFGAIFVFLPEVTLNSIPFIGDGIVTILTTVSGWWNAFLETFPYAVIVWKIFLFVVIPFEMMLLIAKLFLGHRTPVNVN